MASMFAELSTESRLNSVSTPPSSVSPSLTSGGSPATGSGSNIEDQRALQLALELSMLDLSELNAGSGQQNSNPSGSDLCVSNMIGSNQQPAINGLNGLNLNLNNTGNSSAAAAAAAAMAAALISPTQSSQSTPGSLNGLVPGATLNAFTSMLVAAGGLPVVDERSKKSQNMTECVPVPSSEHVAEIVGRQGCKIKALRAKTNTYIKTPVRGEEPVFVVTGRKEDVAKAKREILSAAEHFSLIRASRKPSMLGGLAGKGTPPGPPTNIPGQTTIQVRVPYRVVGLVVGPKGATIKHIQQQTHTYIVTPSRDKEPVFEVTGLPDNVESARRQIEEHISLRTGSHPTLSGSALSGLLNDNSISPSQEFLTSLYKNGLGSLLGYLDPAEQIVGQQIDNQFGQTPQISSSTGSSTCSSNSSTSSKSASMMTRPELLDIWKTLAADSSIDCDEGIGDSPINIWSLPNSSSIIGSRSSPSASASPTDSLLTGGNQSLMKRECLVCGDKEVTTALVPCGHNMFCYDCATRISNTGELCPVCNQTVIQAMRILV